MSSSSYDNNTVRARKQELRKEIRSKLRALSKVDIGQQSHRVWERLKSLDCYQTASSIGVFLSMPSGEIDTDPILQHAVARGMEIYVPHVGRNFEQADMELYQVQYDTTTTTTTTTPSKETDANIPLFHHHWPRNQWRIPEPPAQAMVHAAQPGDLDLLILPGVAFDQCGNRLGQGKGYYDRFLQRLLLVPTNNKKAPVLVAVGLECQLLTNGTVPVNEHDVPVHFVVTPNETIQILQSTQE